MRRVGLFAALALFLLGGVLSRGPARLTVLNDALRIDYPARLAGWAALAACAALAGAILARATWARALLVLFAVATALAAGRLTLYRLEADGQGFTARGLLGGQRLRWAEIESVALTLDGFSLRTAGAGEHRHDTTGLRPADRAVFDRSLARRIREASTAR
jgi:predicted DNA-binding transcriptional regulator AlpA